MVLSEHLPRPGIRTPDLPELSPKVLSIRPPRWCLFTLLWFILLAFIYITLIHLAILVWFILLWFSYITLIYLATVMAYFICVSSRPCYRLVTLLWLILLPFIYTLWFIFLPFSNITMIHLVTVYLHTLIYLGTLLTFIYIASIYHATLNLVEHDECLFAKRFWENYIFLSFQIDWDIIMVTVFLSILNQMEFHLVENQKENCHHDHIPFNGKGNVNIVFSV